MKITVLIFVPVALFTTNVYAQCKESKTLFFCTTTKNKQIEVCDAEKTINYSFGKAQQKPEIAIQVPREQASTFQWSGVGSTMSYAIDIPNGKTTYNVFWGANRMSDEHSIEAGVNVLIDKKLVTTVHCADKNIVNNIEGVNLKPTE